MMTTTGRAYDYKGGVAVKTTRPPAANLSDDVTIVWQDARTISPEQRRKAWALIGEIAAFAGYVGAGDREQLNADMKRQFLIKHVDELTAEAIKRFSLSDIDMTTARLYITFLVDFCIEHGVPTKLPLWEMADDIEQYVYKCSVLKLCAVCRKHAGIHHVDTVGMGRNRDTIDHIGMMHLPLCWGVGGHHQEVEQIGNRAFLEKYHLTPIPIDERIAKIHKLKTGGKA